MSLVTKAGLQRFFAGLKGKFAPISHKHTKSQITDFPTSLPASDVYAWAKTSAKPSYSWSEITSKPTSFEPAAHNQPWNTITGVPALMISGDFSCKTIEALLKQVQGKTPRMGSAAITEDTRIANTWWNFLYVPHRDGVGGDNGDYGTLMLFPMVGESSSYIVRASKGGAVSSIRRIYTTGDKPTNSDVGLGSVNNTADADKSVKYATSAGSANAVAWANVTGKPGSFTPSSHTHDDRYYTESEINSKLGGKANTNHSHSAFGKATADAAGSAGYVPAPAKGQQGQYLRGDGTWATPTNTTYGDATTSAHGLMTAADKAKLNGIASNANNYSHPTSSGNKHIPAGGSAGQILRWSADGTATWGSDSNTTYSAFKGATSSAAGGGGLVPAPGTADVGKVLKGSGAWGTLGKSDVGLSNVDNTADSAKSVKYATSAGSASSATNDSKSQAITGYIRGLSVNGRTVTYTRGDGTTGSITTQDSNTTYGNMTGATANAAGKAGLVPAPAAGTQGSKYLRADGTWQTPPDTNTTYGTASQSANGLMSAADKKKLDGISSGANNFTYSLPTASATVLGGVKTGSNITNTSGVLSLTKANVTSALGYTPPTTDTTYGNATTNSSGLMSSSDKSKLDGIASGANKTVVDGSLSATSTNPVQNKVVYAKNLWLYGGTYKVDSWAANTDGTYTQSAAVTPTDGGPALTASMNLSAPMTAKTTTPATNVTLGKALAIINTGSCVAAAASVAIKVAQKPSCDITVYWYAR